MRGLEACCLYSSPILPLEAHLCWPLPLDQPLDVKVFLLVRNARGRWHSLSLAVATFMGDSKAQHRDAVTTEGFSTLVVSPAKNPLP